VSSAAASSGQAPGPGEWVLVVLAAPVAGWAAWPFHRAALRNARHGSSSMDTLVSLGIIAACGWSVYAMFVLALRRLGLRTILLTGDNQATADAVAAEAGIGEVIAGAKEHTASCLE
jgi:cation transport ATPase